MTKFAENIQARLAEIGKQIFFAKPAERRALQKERSDLEAKLRKAAA